MGHLHCLSGIRGEVLEEEELEVARDRGEGGANLMGDAPRQLSEGREALLAGELVSGLDEGTVGGLELLIL